MTLDDIIALFASCCEKPPSTGLTLPSRPPSSRLDAAAAAAAAHFISTSSSPIYLFINVFSSIADDDLRTCTDQLARPPSWAAPSHPTPPAPLPYFRAADRLCRHDGPISQNTRQLCCQQVVAEKRRALWQRSELLLLQPGDYF